MIYNKEKKKQDQNIETFVEKIWKVKYFISIKIEYNMYLYFKNM